MSQNVVNSVNDANPNLLRTNTPQGNGLFCAAVITVLGPATPGKAGWALLGKSGGENGVTWPNGTRTSHDAIFQVDAAGQKVAGFDIISGAHGDKDGPATRPASPAWASIPPHDWRASNTPVYLQDIGMSMTPVPQPAPPPTPAPAPVDLTPIKRRLDSLEEMVSLQADLIDRLTTQVSMLGTSSHLINGRFSLEMQGDGNLVIYENRDAIWSSETGKLR